MLRLKDNRYFQVSNRLALAAGLMLAVIALAGAPRSESPGAAQEYPVPGTAQSASTLPDDDTGRTKSKWKVRFLLFRRG